jgi:hypothetical protein
MTTESIQALCELMRGRSNQNAEAVEALRAHGLYGHVVGVLRQELDTLIRAIFLLSVGDLGERERLARGIVESGELRKPTGGRIQDRQMLELANRLHGWTEYVYKFGCAYLHLSHLHDTGEGDPFRGLIDEERADILSYLRHYHHAPCSDNPTFDDIKPILPSVLRKISSNLDCYIRDLEGGKVLQARPLDQSSVEGK